MITWKEQEILEEVYLGSRKAQMDIQAVLGKVYNDELALDLNSQAAGYSRIQERAEDVLLDSGMIPVSMGIMERARRWAGIQAATALNISTGHIASLIQETEKESVQKVTQSMEGASVLTSDAYSIGEEFQKFGRQNLKILNAYRG